MDFETAIPEHIREVLIPNVLGWIPTPTPGTFSFLMSQLDDVIPLSKGDVGFVSSDHVREAAKRAIDEGHTGYTYVRDLRVAISEKLKRDNGVEADPDTEIIVSSGCHAIIAQVFRALVGPGDEVVMGSPDLYYRNNTIVRGGRPIYVPLRADRRFHLDPAEVEEAITPNTKIIAITSPDGPTGAVHRQEDLEKIAEIALENDLLIVSDEIYEKVNYGRVDHFSIASLPGMRERTITINGFSKGYAMTGWRVGYAVVPEEFMLAVQAVNALYTIRLNSIAQYAAIAAYRGPQDDVNQRVAEYERKMKILHEGINAIEGLSMHFPDGTYYGWVDISSFDMGAEDFAKHCLFTERVHVSPGPVSFYGPGAVHYVRTSCSPTEEQIREGLERLSRAVERLREGDLVLELENA